MSVNEKMTAIANAIREKTIITEPLTLDAMAENIPFVYEHGYVAGNNDGFATGEEMGYSRGYDEGQTIGYVNGYSMGSEAGKKAEYDAFWDVLQNYGNEDGANYYYKFSYTGWNDDNFNPKYPLICATGTTQGKALFYGNANITDTKVPIIVKGSSAQSMFVNASNLVTIRELNVHKNVAFSSTFVGCVALRNITFSGTIGKDIDFKDSKLLTKASIESIINALSADTSGLTLTLSKTAVNNAFTAEEWDALEATRTNWTISLV